MTAAIIRPSPRWSIPVLVLGCLGVIAFFVLLNPPSYQAAEIEPPPAEALGGGGILDDGAIPGLPEARIQVVPVIPTIMPPVQRARTVLVLRVGPDSRYTTVGQISSGAHVEVVGRNEKGDWLAVSLNPGSKTYGWVLASGVSGIANVSTLPVAPVKSLPTTPTR